MKRQIRRGVFETNSSSMHTLTICSKEEFEAFERGDYYFDYWNDEIVTPEKVIEQTKLQDGYEGGDDFDKAIAFWRCDEDLYEDELRFLTHEEYTENDRYYYYEQEYTTDNGDEVVAFGYYGNDW